MKPVHKQYLLVLLTTLVGCSEFDATLPGDGREPKCEKRSNIDPARLNIDSHAKDYGLIRPCRSYMEFYIAHNTQVRTIDGVITTFRQNSKLNSHEFQLNLSGPENGLFYYNYEVPPMKNYTCDEIIISIDSLQCHNGDAVEIKCPAVRLKTSMIYEDLRINMHTLDVCFDN